MVKENKLGTAPMFRLILSMSLPAMFSMLIQALYNIVDSVFVSNYSNSVMTGGESLLAVNIAFPLQMILVAVAVGAGVGVNSLIARRLGAKMQSEADSAATHGFVMSIIHWVLFVVIGIVVAQPFVSLYTNDATVSECSVAYIRIALICSLGMNIACMLEKVLQSTGNMIMPMLSQLIGAVINIALDPVFIYVFDLGVAGAAIATVIAQHISALLCVFFLFGKKQLVKIRLKSFKLNGTTLKNIYVVALPAMVMQAIGSFMVMGINYIISLANANAVEKDAAINVFGVYFKLQSFVFMPVFGINQGCTPIIGYNYGAGNKKRMYGAIKWAAIFAVIIMTCGFIIFQIVPEALLGMFSPNKEMIEIGTVALRIISLCFIPAALGIVLTGVFQAVGKGIRSLIMSLLRQLGVIVPVAFFLSKISLKDMWFAFPIAEAVSLLVASLFFINLVKGDFKRLKPIE
ncbi:MAG: MATE family efflux transporter [Ruminococcus sp.]